MQMNACILIHFMKMTLYTGIQTEEKKEVSVHENFSFYQQLILLLIQRLAVIAKLTSFPLSRFVLSPAKPEPYNCSK